MRKFKVALLSGAGLLALSAAAQAQVPMPGFYAHGFGWYVLDSGPKDTLTAGDVRVGTDDGWGGGLALGYRFQSPWDVAIAGQGAWLSKGKANFGGEGFGDQIKGRYFTVDGELGYTITSGGFAIRPFFGPRYVNWEHKTNDQVEPIFRSEIDRWGIGPRIGADMALRFGTSGFFGTASFAGSTQWGKTKGKANADLGTPSSSDNGMSYNVEGMIGVGYEFSPGGINLVVGYRGEKWWNVSSTDVGTNFNKNGDRWMHGPTVRLAYNFGPPIVSAIPVEPMAPAVDTRRFVVFFDWDRSNITAQASSTIRQAADAYRAGNSTRVAATGHTDRSGSDQYNMALSLRRANAVKEELIRDGVPAANIVVLGRGETQPLVQTADGVREPQNRRVEIVIE